MSRNQKQATDSNSSMNTRDRIIDAARDEFSIYGLAGARVDRIARKAIVNKAMIYYHFSSKENLYREVIGSFFAEISDRFKEHLDSSQSIEELLDKIAETYSQLLTRHSLIRPIILRELANPRDEVLDMITEMLSASGLPGVLQARLSEGVKDGTLRPVDPRQAVLSFILLNVGYSLVAPVANKLLKVDNTKRFITERKQAVVDLFLYGLKVRKQ